MALETADGEQGIGECAPLPEAGSEHPEAAASWLRKMLPICKGHSAGNLLRQLPSDAPPAARFGLETALLDLLCKAEGVPIHTWLSPASANWIGVNAALGTLGEETAARIDRALAEGYPVLKIKVGVGPVEDELQAIRRLSERLGTQTRVRLDANGAWTPEQATRFIENLDGDLVESLEEPLKLPDRGSLATLQKRTRVSIALDESLPLFLKNVPLDQLPVRRIVIKPSLFGGLIPSMEILRAAAGRGIESVVTSLLESNIGILAAAHLAAAADKESPVVHGLATGGWFARNTAPAPIISGGRLQLPAGAGLGLSGVTLSPAPLAKSKKIQSRPRE